MPYFDEGGTEDAKHSKKLILATGAIDNGREENLPTTEKNEK